MQLEKMQITGHNNCLLRKKNLSFCRQGRLLLTWSSLCSRLGGTIIVRFARVTWYLNIALLVMAAYRGQETAHTTQINFFPPLCSHQTLIECARLHIIVAIYTWKFRRFWMKNEKRYNTLIFYRSHWSWIFHNLNSEYISL